MSSSSSPTRTASRSVASSVTCPGYQGSAAAASAVTRTEASPHTSALVRKSSTAATSCSSELRSPIDANSFVNGTAAASACNNKRASVAALTDCRDWALAASAAIDPGGGWVRSGRDSSSRMIRSSGSSANQAPSGTPLISRVASLLPSGGDTSVIADQPKPAAPYCPPVSPARASPATMWGVAEKKPQKKRYVDNGWPEVNGDDDHAVS